MKKLLRVSKKLTHVFALLLSFVTFMYSQFTVDPYTLSRPPIIGSSPFQDSLWAVDSSAHNIVLRHGPILPGFTITGMTSITVHPHTGEHFLIMKLSGVSGRVLGKINVLTGVCSQVGNLGDNFATISFREDGQLFGVTGNGAAVPETMYLIDHTNGTKVLAAALGAGADGEIISYNYDDDFFYHWSGNSTVVYEKVMSVAPYTATNIPIIGTTSGETFGAVYLGSNRFRTSNISSSFNHFFTTGNVTPAIGSNPDDLRGLGLIGRWISGPLLETIGVCDGDSIMLEALVTGNQGNTHKYQWVRNGVNIPGADSNIYYANSSTGTGRYNCRIIMDSLYTNNQTMDSAITAYTDTAWFGRTLIFNPAPGLTPTPIGYLCDATDTLTLVNSYSGTNQWYLNGSAIVGATNDSLLVTATGLYNVGATQVAGCVDTMAIPTTVLIAPSPTLTNTPDMCFGDSVLLTANTGSAQYNWLLNGSLSATTVPNMLYVSADGNYSVETQFGTCIDTSVIAALDFAPQYDVTPNGAGSVCFGTNQLLTATAGGTAYEWLLNGSTIGGATSDTYNATAAGDYTCIITFPGCIDTAGAQFTLSFEPQYDVTPSGTGSICIGSNQLLTATAGGSSYQWLSNGTAIGGATSQTLTATLTGVYECIITFPGCTDTTVSQFSLTAVDCSGIEENTSVNISLYPNPAHQQLNISVANDVIMQKIEVVDLSGRKVISTKPNTSNTSINVEELSSGIYMLSITTPSGTKTKRFIKN